MKSLQLYQISFLETKTRHCPTNNMYIKIEIRFCWPLRVFLCVLLQSLVHLWENHVWVCAAWTPSQRGKAATLYPSFVGCFCLSCERIPETGDQIWAEKPAREKVTMKWGLQVRRGNIRTPISNSSIHKVKPGICEQISKSEVLDGSVNGFSISC